MKELIERFVLDEDAALDQWVTVLILAILAISTYVVLTPLIQNIFVGVTNNLGSTINNLIP